MGSIHGSRKSSTILLLLIFTLELSSVLSASSSSTLKEKPRKGNFKKKLNNEVDNDLLPSDVISTRAVGPAKPLLSNTPAVVPIPDSEAVEAALPPPSVGGKGDLKGADSFGLGYYVPVLAHTLVKYHPYPILYYHQPTTYLHSVRHHGYGGLGFYHHGHHTVHHPHSHSHHQHHSHHGQVHGVLH